MEENTQLPVEVVKQIWFEAEKYTEEKVKAINEEHFNVYNAWIAGATAYATKLYQLQGENEKAKVLLKRAIIEDNMEATELSTDLRNAIKKFLYGE